MQLVAETPRRTWVTEFPQVQCPNGHRMRGLAHALASAVLCCGARPAGGGLPCGGCVYVVRQWRGDRYSLVVEVKRDDIVALAALFSIEEQLRYLGVLTSEVVPS